MKHLLTFLMFFLIYTTVFAQQPTDPKQLWAKPLLTIDSSNANPVLTLNWANTIDNKIATIQKKYKTDAEFNPFPFIFDSTVTSFSDTIARGISYEYALELWNGTFSSWAFLNVGVDLPAVENRGRILILVDDSVYLNTSFEINRYISDLRSEGWQPTMQTVPRTPEFSSESVKNCKKIVTDKYIDDGDTLQCLVLIGRVAVPYSGLSAVDGHKEHTGAWPADVFYTDIDGEWTDTTANYTNVEFPAQTNLIGDGKFDQSYIPTKAELMCGRIDFYDLPSFVDGEMELYKKYFDKNHEYRRGNFDYEQNAIIDDKFMMYSKEAFAATAWISFGALFEPSAIDTGSIRYLLNDKKYHMSYGCNSGGSNSCMYIAYADEYAKLNYNTVFLGLFGSWFGDWNMQDNILRVALASSPSILCTYWTGRPYWIMHHLGMGETMGYAARLSANYSNEYLTASSYGYHGMHVSLMGDPTLRIRTVKPVTEFAALSSDTTLAIAGQIYRGAMLSWNQTLDTSATGYYIYAKSNTDNAFHRIAELPINRTNFIDTNFRFGLCEYRINVIKKETTPTGSYYNLSSGDFASVENYPDIAIRKGFSAYIYPNPVPHGKFTMYVKSEKQDNLHLEIYDSHGKLVQQQNISVNKDHNMLEINLKSHNASYSQGMYFMIISSSDAKQRIEFAVVK